MNQNPPPQEDKLPDTKAKHLQDLYRKLAKRYHPDKAMDTKEAERREQLMPLINRAYTEQDLETLERLSLGETELQVPEKTAIEKRRATPNRTTQAQPSRERIAI